MEQNYDLETTPPNEILRNKYAMDDAWIEEFMARAAVGHLATRWEDQPFITPLNFWYDKEKHAIFFHTNIEGRLRANIERHPRACFEASGHGRLLEADTALEFSIQYEGVVAFGRVRIIDDPDEQRRALYGLIRKYFPEKEPGIDYALITDEELGITSVFKLEIDSWSGKRNWETN